MMQCETKGKILANFLLPMTQSFMRILKQIDRFLEQIESHTIAVFRVIHHMLFF